MSEMAPPAAGETTEPAALGRVRTVAYLLDDAFRIPGTNARVGLDPIVGILPGIGDGAMALVSLYVVLEAVLADAPPGLLAKMLAIVAVDAVVGSIPLVGPVFDAVWKANAWNVRLLSDHLEAEAEGAMTGVGDPR